MKILLTGASGFIGRELGSQLKSYNHSVMLTGRTHLSELFYPGFSIWHADITDHMEINRMITEFRPDVIIHTAAISAPDECEGEKQLAHAINVKATKNLFESASSINTHFILLSTDFVFDGSNGPYNEDDQRNAVNYYGETKIEAENILLNSNHSWSIIRTVLSYGKQIPGFRKSFQAMVLDNIEAGRELRLADDQFRTPTYLPDLASGIIKIAENKIPGIFNLAGNEYLSVYEFGVMIANIAGKDAGHIIPVKTSELDHPARRPLKTGLISTKARQIFGYSHISLEEGLKNLIC